MATRSKTVCPVHGCATLTDRGRCDKHRQEAEQKRGTASQRGYSSPSWRTVRAKILKRDPVCMVCGKQPSKHADHHPRSRKELLAEGVADPDSMQWLRGLCASCHSRETARAQPGGWNRRD